LSISHSFNIGVKKGVEFGADFDFVGKVSKMCTGENLEGPKTFLHNTLR
jgi:hypothetical protein